jgi:hypothetical protein
MIVVLTSQSRLIPIIWMFLYIEVPFSGRPVRGRWDDPAALA